MAKEIFDYNKDISRMEKDEAKEYVTEVAHRLEDLFDKYGTDKEILEVVQLEREEEEDDNR